MVDLILAPGTVLTVDAAYPLEPEYELLQLGDNSTLIAKVDLVLNAQRARFGNGCLIDGRGIPGGAGADGLAGGTGGGFLGPSGSGGPGVDGQPGGPGRNLIIAAALEDVGGLTITSDGGPGGTGGAGGQGVITFVSSGHGGAGGAGGAGGDAGQIALIWTRAAPGLPTDAGQVPSGHVYRSQGGVGGAGGAGGLGAVVGNAGLRGARGADGTGSALQIAWRADLAPLIWVQAQDMGPAPRSDHGVVYDPTRGKLVLFGGLVGGKPAGDTWEWDGSLWTQVADMGPPARAFHGMGYDAAGNRVLLFGGSASAADASNDQRQYLGDTWGWDGEAWVQLADVGPTSRQGPAMAGDPERKRVVLFSGGRIGAAAVNVGVSDTWEWDGSVWAQVADTGPSARLDARLAYDVDGGKMLLFGGSGSGPPTADTWQWDGANWTQVADTGPSPRIGHAMAGSTGGVVLFGGLSPGGGGASNDTWTWTGGVWRQTQDMGPAARNGHAMDSVGGIVTLFGGQGAAALRDTWRLDQLS